MDDELLVGRIAEADDHAGDDDEPADRQVSAGRGALGRGAKALFDWALVVAIALAVPRSSASFRKVLFALRIAFSSRSAGCSASPSI